MIVITWFVRIVYIVCSTVSICSVVVFVVILYACTYVLYTSTEEQLLLSTVIMNQSIDHCYSNCIQAMHKL